MNKLKFEGVHKAYDGEYEFDIGAGFTNREWHIIKQIAGVRVGEFDDALAAGDNDLVVAIATIVLKRYGKEVDADTLWDTAAGTITMEVDEVPDEDPTPLPDTRTSSSPESSGRTSENGSGSPENDPSRIGSPDSELVLETSAN